MQYSSNSPNSPSQDIDINRNHFNFLYVIGKGGFGRVWKVQSKKTKETYALKEMSKLKVLDKKSEKSINSERAFLSKLHHPFIVNMHYAFQDNDNLYLVIDLLSGGDLRYHISRYRRFSEEQTRFFIACIVLSLQYIHQNNVIHRDIKPENLVLDSAGYLRVTDFGIAKENTEDNSSETSGTPGYMAPEVMRGKHHSFCVDFFAIGVIGYEFMIGRRPYVGKDRKEIKEQMINKQARISKDNIVLGWSNESIEFINACLMRKIDLRLGGNNGMNGVRELMGHSWLKYYPWNDLIKKKLQAPFVPEKKDNFDRRYCESVDKITEETKMRYVVLMNRSKYRNAFISFYFNKYDKRNEIHRNNNFNNSNAGTNEYANEKLSNNNGLNSSNSLLMSQMHSASAKNIFSFNSYIPKHKGDYNKGLYSNKTANILNVNLNNGTSTKTKPLTRSNSTKEITVNKNPQTNKMLLEYCNENNNNNNSSTNNIQQKFIILNSNNTHSHKSDIINSHNNNNNNNSNNQLNNDVLNSNNHIRVHQSNFQNYNFNYRKNIHQDQDMINSNLNNNNNINSPLSQGYTRIIKTAKTPASSSNNLINNNNIPIYYTKHQPISSSKGNYVHMRASSVGISKDENSNHNNIGSVSDLSKYAYNTSQKLSKLNSARAKAKMEKNINENNIEINDNEIDLISNNNSNNIINAPYKKLNRVNSANKITCKPSTEFLYNKIKSIAIVNSNNSRLNFFK